MAKAKAVAEVEVTKEAPEFVALNLVNREYDAEVIKLSVPRVEDKNSEYVDQVVNMEIAVQVHPDDVVSSDIRSALFSEQTTGRSKATKRTYGDKVAMSPPRKIEGWRVELHDPDAEEEWEELKGKKLLLLGFVPQSAGTGDVLLRVTGLDHSYGGRLMYPFEFRVRFIEHEGSDKEEDDRQTHIDQFVDDEEEEQG